MKTTPIHLLLPLILLLSTACGGRISEEDRKAIEETKKRRSFKKVKEADIIAEALRRGRLISKSLEQDLWKGDQNTSDTVGQGRLPIPDPNLSDSLSKHYGADIRLYPLGEGSGPNLRDSVENILMEVYQHNEKHGLDMRDNVQKLGKKWILYTKPLLRKAAIAEKTENSGGGRDFSPEDSIMMKKEEGYPQLLGMWGIRISKKEIIRDF